MMASEWSFENNLETLSDNLPGNKKIIIGV
jgi:hypothetical protein